MVAHAHMLIALTLALNRVGRQVRRLIDEFGALPTCRDANYKTPLHYAAAGGHVSIYASLSISTAW
jgi:ankyrin repeat protein